MKKFTMFFAAMLFALVAFAQDTEVTVPEVTTMEDLKQHAGERVLYKGLEPQIVTMGYETIAYMPDGETMFIFPASITPAKMDVYGVYTAPEEEGMFGFFEVSEMTDVVAVSAFNKMSELVDYVSYMATEEQKMLSFEVKEPVVVTFVNPKSSEYYIQYESYGQYYGMKVQSGGISPMPLSLDASTPYQPKVGDKITLKGVFMPMTTVENEGKNKVSQLPAFMVETATFVEANQEIKPLKIEGVEAGLNPSLAGSYVALLDGKVVEKDGAYYYERGIIIGTDPETYDYIYGLDSIYLHKVGDVDFSQSSEGLALCGILHFDLYSQKYQLYAVEFRDLTLYAENLAEMFEFGKTNEMQEQYVLKNPVLVTYVDVNGSLVVEDETATAYVQLAVEFDEDWNVSVPGLENLQVGYYITKFVGVPSSSGGYLKFVDVNATNLVKGEKGTITPIEVALKDLIADREAETSQYAFKVVSVKDITFELWSEEDGEVADAYLVQNNGETLDSVVTNVKTWRKLGVAVPEIGAKIETLVGIADIYSAITSAMGYVSIQPLNAASVVVPGAGDQTNVENVEVANIYSENGLIVAEGEFQIFTITGQNVTNMNGKLQSGVYVVRTANATAKVVVK